jgi:acetoin:2,6-dichlorophenolindophenol oxidoreductase subunit alpha
LCGRVTGVNRGRSNSFHPSDAAQGVFIAGGTVGHVGGLAAGIAWTVQQTGTGQVVACSFGDGAMNQGALLEAFNLASLWQVPVVYVCERNGYAATVPIELTHAGSITARAAAFGIPTQTVDGMDPHTVLDAARQAVQRARQGGGPTLLEMITYRFDVHHTFEHKARPQYREDDEIAAWRAKDPLATQARRVDEAQRRWIDAEVEDTLDEAVRFALASPAPDPEDAYDYLYASGLRVRPGVVSG